MRVSCCAQYAGHIIRSAAAAMESSPPIWIFFFSAQPTLFPYFCHNMTQFIMQILWLKFSTYSQAKSICFFQLSLKHVGTLDGDVSMVLTKVLLP
jgi:hypothetical protein